MFDRVRKLIAGPSTMEREAEYLSQSANRYDLEMRQREIDRGLFRQRRPLY
ncbi:MAG TPA: DUF3563 domain-containing protein [Methylomirabilota bacterium]|nr:DUF3563 domain-containing protein [Methylomirabilota bacterium]